MKAAVFILAGAILVAHPGVTRAQSVGVSVGNVGAGMPMAGAPSFNTSIFSGGRQAGAPQAIDPVREVHPLGSVLATSQSGVATLPGSAALTGTPVGLALPVGQQTQPLGTENAQPFGSSRISYTYLALPQAASAAAASASVNGWIRQLDNLRPL